jgi:hypothetical protein
MANTPYELGEWNTSLPLAIVIKNRTYMDVTASAGTFRAAELRAQEYASPGCSDYGNGTACWVTSGIFDFRWYSQAGVRALRSTSFPACLKYRSALRSGRERTGWLWCQRVVC